MIFQITYELKRPDSHYADLFATIQNIGTSYVHVFKNMWWVETNKDVNIVVDEIRKKMDNNDLLFVVEISSSRKNGWLAKSSWEWLSNKK